MCTKFEVNSSIPSKVIAPTNRPTDRPTAFFVICRSVGRSVGLFVGAITFEGIELLTSNLVHTWISIGERFGLFLSQFGSGEGGKMGG